MPWERRTVEDQRREFAQAAIQCSNSSALCREFGIDRGIQGTSGKSVTQLSSRSQTKADNLITSPGRTPEEVELLILAVRADNPGWGAKTIRDVLLVEGHNRSAGVGTPGTVDGKQGICVRASNLPYKNTPLGPMQAPCSLRVLGFRCGWETMLTVPCWRNCGQVEEEIITASFC